MESLITHANKNKTYRVCKYCVLRYGIKGSELAEKSFEDDETFYNHIEEEYGVIVKREGESSEQATIKCAAKGIVSDRSKCQCQECKELRKNFALNLTEMDENKE